MIERVCGSAELNATAPGATEITLSSEFATTFNDAGESPGCALLLKLRPPTITRAMAPRLSQLSRTSRRSSGVASTRGQLSVQMTWSTLEGSLHSASESLQVPAAEAELPAALRKALALVRFVDLQNTFCFDEVPGLE